MRNYLEKIWLTLNILLSPATIIGAQFSAGSRTDSTCFLIEEEEAKNIKVQESVRFRCKRINVKLVFQTINKRAFSFHFTQLKCQFQTLEMSISTK